MGKYRSDFSFSEDQLPPGQQPILTSSVQRFIAFMKMLTDADKGYPVMGLVTGAAGIGKTVSIQAYLSQQKPRAHTSLPAVIKIKIKPKSTPKALAVNIARELGDDDPKGSNVWQVADGAVEVIERNDLRCIVVDEADRLNEDTFDVLRYLFDETGCPIAIVGLPRIEGVIDRHAKFESRVGLRMKFLPLKRDEILDVVLPNLVFPKWEFDPSNERDLVMGERICDLVKTSLRKLRNLLQAASQMAQYENKRKITLTIINEAFRWTASRQDKRRAKAISEEDDEPQPERGKYEAESEARKDAKRRKIKDEQ